MALLQRFDPPAFLSDYDGIPGHREAWHAFVSRCFELSIASEAGRVGSGLQQAEVRAASQWVIPTGGGYFFVPSTSALRDVIAR
jgi:hypothetical protein